MSQEGPKRAGLQTAGQVREEADRRRSKEMAKLNSLGLDESGRYAKTIYRDKLTGKRIDVEAESKEKLEQKRREEEALAKYKDWGKGLVQVRKAAEQREAYEKSKEKPLATYGLFGKFDITVLSMDHFRYADDVDLNLLQKDRLRWGDPMAHVSEKPVANSDDQGSRRPAYRGPPGLPNRFNIPPGHRWDGVGMLRWCFCLEFTDIYLDRSTGFEKQLFEAKSKRAALQDASYSWSVEDM